MKLKAVFIIILLASGSLLTSNATAAEKLYKAGPSGNSERNGRCNTVWIGRTHHWRYDGFVPKWSVITKMKIRTNAFLGSSTDPYACYQKWYFMDRMTNEGWVWANQDCHGCAPPTMLKMHNSAHNQAWYETEDTDTTIGFNSSHVKKPECGTSKHTYRFKNTGRTITKLLHTGQCGVD